jgi:predicted glycosyltransferase
VSCVVLARHPHQREEIASLGLERVFLPAQAIDSRSLLWHADLFVGAGGTMSREAALLGIPSLSVFGGKPAAVDLELQRQGLLRLVGQPEEIGLVRPAPERTEPVAELAVSGRRLIDLFSQTTVAAAR